MNKNVEILNETDVTRNAYRGLLIIVNKLYSRIELCKPKVFMSMHEIWDISLLQKSMNF